MFRVAVALSVIVLLAGCRQPGPAAQPAPSANAWAVVNGHEISKDDVDKAYRRMAPDGQQPSEEEIYTAKLNLLSELIVQELLVAKAKELKVELPESELDNAFNEAKKNITPIAFEEELKRRNLTAADMREDLRRKETGDSWSPVAIVRRERHGLRSVPF